MADAEQITGQIKEQTQQVIQQGQQYAGHVMDIVGSRIKTALTQQKDALATGITDAAQILKQNGDSFRTQGIGALAAPYIDQAADKLTEVGTTIKGKDTNEIIRDVENFARVQPAYFLGIAALLGFAAARFLKSTSAQAAAS